MIGTEAKQHPSPVSNDGVGLVVVVGVVTGRVVVLPLSMDMT